MAIMGGSNRSAGAGAAAHTAQWWTSIQMGAGMQQQGGHVEGDSQLTPLSTLQKPFR